MKEGIKIYSKWVYCCKEKCGESEDGKCNLRGEKKEFPSDNMCYFPNFYPYSDKLAELVVFETTETEIKDVPF